MKYRLTRPALRDLAEIGCCSRKHWSGQQAHRYGTAITAPPKWLCHNRPVWHEPPELAAGIFSYPHQSHVTIFRAYLDGIEIPRVLHRRTDLARHLRDHANEPPGQ